MFYYNNKGGFYLVKKMLRPITAVILTTAIMTGFSNTAFAEDTITGKWYGNFYGLQATLELEDNNKYSIRYNSENPTYGKWTQKDDNIILDNGEDNELDLTLDGDALVFTSDDSVNLRSLSPDVDEISDSPSTSNYLDTDGQREVDSGSPSTDDFSYSFYKNKSETKETNSSDIDSSAKCEDFDGIWQVQKISSNFTSFPGKYYGIEDAFVFLETKHDSSMDVQFYLKLDSMDTPLKTDKVEAEMKDGCLTINASNIIGANKEKLSDAIKEVKENRKTALNNAESIINAASAYIYDENSENNESTNKAVKEESKKADKYIIKINKLVGDTESLVISICNNDQNLYHVYLQKNTTKNIEKMFTED